jgi:hypothetical protein
VLAAYDVGSREKAGSYGVLSVAGDRVAELQEKPDFPNSTLVSIACYAFPAEDVRFDEYLSGGNNPDEPGWFIQWLVDDSEVHAFTFDEAWFDIGTPESYLDAVSWYLDGENFVHETATVTDSELGENVYVMENSVVEGSKLERSVIFRDSTIRGADIREKGRFGLPATDDGAVDPGPEGLAVILELDRSLVYPEYVEQPLSARVRRLQPVDFVVPLFAESIGETEIVLLVALFERAGAGQCCLRVHVCLDALRSLPECCE